MACQFAVGGDTTAGSAAARAFDARATAVVRLGDLLPVVGFSGT
jgi:hypothetical protein